MKILGGKELITALVRDATTQRLHGWIISSRCIIKCGAILRKRFHYMQRWQRGEVKVQLHPYSTLALGGVGWSLP